MKKLLLLLPLLALASCSKPPEGLIQLTCEGKHAEREREFIVNADTGSLFRYYAESDKLIEKNRTVASEDMESLWTSKRDKYKLVITKKTQYTQAYFDQETADRDRASGAYYCRGRAKCIAEYRANKDKFIKEARDTFDFSRYSIDLKSLTLTVFYQSSVTEDTKWTESCVLTEPPTTELATSNP